MSSYTVKAGRRYRAQIRLGFFEGIASNGQIADKLKEAGFVDVNVWGSGRDRVAEATWRYADASAELPEQIKSVTEI